jgi:hypothetical protein
MEVAALEAHQAFLDSSGEGWHGRSASFSLDDGATPQRRRAICGGTNRGGAEAQEGESQMKSIIYFVLSEFVLTFLVLGLVFAAVGIARAPKPVTRAVVVEKVLSWHVFFVIGVMFFYNFVCHCFFGEMAAHFIGWADSPFQFEVGTASLGFSMVGFLAAFHSFDRRLVAIVGPAFFFLGAAAGHAYQMVTMHNFAPGNAGIIFYLDILIPLFGFVLLYLQWKDGKAKAARVP